MSQKIEFNLSIKYCARVLKNLLLVPNGTSRKAIKGNFVYSFY